MSDAEEGLDVGSTARLGSPATGSNPSPSETRTAGDDQVAPEFVVDLMYT
jgi:hypothetical protein